MRLWTTLADEVEHLECGPECYQMDDGYRVHECVCGLENEEPPATFWQITAYVAMICAFWAVVFWLIWGVLR